MYIYRFRPGYGSDEFLLEFTKNAGSEEFYMDLFDAFSSINCKTEVIDDEWNDDELVMHIHSDIGSFELSQDSLNTVFILTEDNQKGLKLLEELLQHSKLFSKEEVNHKRYSKTENQ